MKILFNVASTFVGHLVTMHHPLMGSARPILFSHQGFPLTANQFFNDSIYSSSSLAHFSSSSSSLLPSALNDAPLEFNALRPKTGKNILIILSTQLSYFCVATFHFSFRFE